jgi:acid phosphatase family membrane protein YuiD
MAIENNLILMVASVAVASILALACKLALYCIKERKISWRAIFRAMLTGGAPSSHSAFSASLATSVFLIEGFSLIFLVTLGFALVIVYDAFATRANIDRNFRQLDKSQKMRRIGHTFYEAVAGVIIGIIAPVILFLIF